MTQPSSTARTSNDKGSGTALPLDRCRAARLYHGAELRCVLAKGHTHDHEARFYSAISGRDVAIAWTDPRSPIQRWAR